MELFNGFKFGLLLQLAIGPIILMALQISSTLGLIQGFVFVGATTLVDALYIFLACIGIVTFLEKENIQRIFKYLGCFVLIIFGLNIIFGIFNITIIPNIKIKNIDIFENIFIRGLIINLSNPLVIIFWGGIFSGKIANNNYNKKQIYLFSIGCLLSTIIVFSMIVLIGNFIKIILSAILMKILNGIVEIVIIIIGIKMVLKKNKAISNVA
jgi:threonine/homoserine/homoserine lactone efflux protein